MLNLFLVYQFIRRLATPFDEWEAFDLGIIDDEGEILISRKKLKTVREKEAFGAYDLMILNLKKMLEKVPGGNRRLASYAAALYLLKEWNHFTPETMLNESITDQEISESINSIQPLLSVFVKDKPIIPYAENAVNHKVHDLDKMFEEKFKEEAPTNSAGGGEVAGIGVGPDGEPGFTPAQRIRYLAKNKRKKKKDISD